jgi:hypothetical protein
MAGKPDFGIRQMPMMRNPRGSLGEYNDRLLERQIASPGRHRREPRPRKLPDQRHGAADE